MTAIDVGNTRMRELFGIPHQEELVGKVTLLDLHPEPQLVRLYRGGQPVSAFMPLTAARGLLKVLEAQRISRKERSSYSIRQNVEGGRGGNSAVVW